MRQLDTVFVNTSKPEKMYQKLAEKYAAIEVPYWSLLLAESCRAQGFKVDIIDVDAEKLTKEEAGDRIKHLNPRLVCFVSYGGNPNASSFAMDAVNELAEYIKQISDIKICSIGNHTSALPAQVLSNPNIDFITINEGVKALHNLIRSDLKNYLGSISALGFKKDGKNIINNGVGSLVENEEMDRLLPGYAIDLLPKKEKPLDLYRSHFWHNNYSHEHNNAFAMYSSLGCYKKCEFCMISIINRTDEKDGVHSGHSSFMRFWSPQWILKQMDILRDKYEVKNLRICDELFLGYRKHYQPIIEGMIEKQYNFNTWCYSRYDVVKKQYLDLFKKAGFTYFGIGIESGSQQIRREIDKGGYEDVDIREIINDIRQAGINPGLNYMYGFPDETHREMQQTLDLALELQGEFTNMYCAVALPGSKLYYEHLERGWYTPQTSEEYSFLSYEHIPCRTKYLTSAQVLEFRDKAWQTYFTNPNYLSMIERKFSIEARNNIVEQTKIKLRRKILGD